MKELRRDRGVARVQCAFFFSWLRRLDRNPLHSHFSRTNLNARLWAQIKHTRTEREKGTESEGERGRQIQKEGRKKHSLVGQAGKGACLRLNFNLQPIDIGLGLCLSSFTFRYVCIPCTLCGVAKTASRRGFG